MLKTAIIGVGNTGNQVAALAASELGIPVLAINSSEKDLETVRNKIPCHLIKSEEGPSQGAGKNRMLAKEYLKASIMGIISDSSITDVIAEQDIVFVVSSTGGGTGSGTAPLIYSILSQTFPDTLFIMIGVLPVMSEALSAHVNTIEYWKELYSIDGVVYMMYDNEKYADMASYQALSAVNKEIVADIDVLRCQYNYTTPFDSIDEEDMRRMISCPGRIMVVRLQDIKERDVDNIGIEEMLVKRIKTCAHAEMQRDQQVVSTGVISNLSENISGEFDNHIEKVREFVGTPDHDFTHTVVNSERQMPNNVFLIMTGLSPINERINRTNDRISEIEARQTQRAAENNVLETLDTDTMSRRASSRDGSRKAGTNYAANLDIANIFNKFGVK